MSSHRYNILILIVVLSKVEMIIFAPQTLSIRKTLREYVRDGFEVTLVGNMTNCNKSQY